MLTIIAIAGLKVIIICVINENIITVLKKKNLAF